MSLKNSAYRIFSIGLAFVAALSFVAPARAAKEKKMEKGVQAVTLPKEAPVKRAPVVINVQQTAAKIDELVELSAISIPQRHQERDGLRWMGAPLASDDR